MVTKTESRLKLAQLIKDRFRVLMLVLTYSKRARLLATVVLLKFMV